MVKNKKDNEKKYHYILIILCKECGKEAETIGPCVKCGNLTFFREYKAVEKK